MEVIKMIGKVLRVTLAILIGMLVAIVIAKAQNSRSQSGTAFNNPATTQPLYSEYKGVRIGMTANEVQAKLGKAGMRVDEQEFYVISDQETVQIVYDKANAVEGISVDFLGGVGAPDYRAVVGPDITVKPDGSLYKMVRYEKLGFWVSYNRTANAVVTVTITIQKIR